MTLITEVILLPVLVLIYVTMVHFLVLLLMAELIHGVGIVYETMVEVMLCVMLLKLDVETE